MTTITERIFVYAIGSEDGPVKVGITQNLLSRLRMLQTGSAQKLELIFVHTFDDRAEAHRFEQWFHRCEAEKRLAGEWFSLTAEEAFEQFELLVTMQYDFRHLRAEFPDREGPAL